jgi:DNA modification methylase
MAVSTIDVIKNDTLARENTFINDINFYNDLLKDKFFSVMSIDPILNRKVVSFQANKSMPFYRWYKYKEGFSANLVNYYIHKHGIHNIKTILDPFAGSGSALFAASELEINSVGIELLPIGQKIIESRNLLINNFSNDDFNRLMFWKENEPWINFSKELSYNVLKITDNAYSKENDHLIKKYLACMKEENERVQCVLLLALICILENISFTRKDGQYLRWDQRSGKCLKAIPFNKGEIKEFTMAIKEKLNEIIFDTKKKEENGLFDETKNLKTKGKIKIIGGSCLLELPKIADDSIELIITSPPYCNRYDYTRTYALELAMLGINENELLSLRQEMLSCTVENREKDLISINKDWIIPLNYAKNQLLLQSILKYLNHKREQRTLNNNGIPRMIKGYFYEMACVIFEMYRILNHNGEVVMVNDNVKYAGISISVDLILSEIASNIGFNVEAISILPIGKGNSSQQMGEHGRESLRKCVYIWRKK